MPLRANTVNEEFDEIVAALDMETWLDREGVRYRPTRGARGAQLNVRECPVCGNTHWKVYLNAASGLGNCFSGDCEKKFNKWSFVRASLGHMTTREVADSIKQAAKEQGWRPPKRMAVAVDLSTNLLLPESVALPIDGRNLKYLENRNITPMITRYFGLRYSANGAFRYKSEEGKNHVQSYAKRILIPIFSLDGDLVSFQGRDITGTADKKYLFPPGFSATGSIIYNGQNALGAERAVIGEGVFDVMAIKIALDGQMELRDVAPLGSFGKHLSFGDDNSQVAKLLLMKENGLRQVTFMWDGEEQALEDAIAAGLLLRRYGFVARIAILPKDRDPNEVAASVVREAFWKAVVVNEAVATRMRLAKRAA